MTKILVDGKEYEVNKDKNLLDTCLSLGFDIPYFCYHPALGSVGACRLCAVKKYNNDNDKTGKIVMSCMEPVQEGMRISTDDPEVKEFRKAVIESLMINHPHDCPICDEGGECHLQDMTVMTGQNYRHYEFKKRTFRNQDLGPYINHEMNRCIQCYRCVRYYRDYAGGKDLNVFGARNSLYFGRAEDGQLESEFSGNLVEVCPTGVFTDKTLKKHYTRKWDLTNSPSICPHCSLGCNIIISERYGILRRVLNRYNGEVNGYFICDRGRFGYEFANNKNRLKSILFKQNKTDEFKKIAQDELKLKLGTLNFKQIIGIGSPNVSLESNYVLKQLVGKDNFYIGTSQKEYVLTKRVLEIYTNNPAKIPSLKDIEKCDAVLILGEDIMKTAPMVALAVRQSVLQKPLEEVDKLKIPRWNDQAVKNLIGEDKGPLYIVDSSSLIVDRTSSLLDDIATDSIKLQTEDIAKFALAIANILYNEKTSLPDELLNKAKEIADSLKNAKNPLIISGTFSDNIDIINASANIAEALCTDNKISNLFYILPDCNSLGLSMFDGKPIEELGSKNYELGIVLEDASIDLKYLKEIKNLIWLSHSDLETFPKFETLEKLSVLAIPVTTVYESNGTFVNNEGRAQRFYSAFPENKEIKESWKWLEELGIRNYELGINKKINNDFETWDELIEEIVKDYPIFEGIQNIAPSADFRLYGTKVPRQTFRFSGRTAMNAGIDVSEQKPPDDNESPLAFTMEGYKGIPPSELTPFYWRPGWNSVQALNEYQEEIGGTLNGGNTGIKLIKKKKK